MEGHSGVPRRVVRRWWVCRAESGRHGRSERVAVSGDVCRLGGDEETKRGEKEETH